MPTFIIPAPVRDYLKDVKEPAELYDDSGNHVGRFLPTEECQKQIFREPPPLSDEEWRRIEAQPGYTPEEVIALLEKLS